MARIGGPLLLTAGVWAGGVGVAHPGLRPSDNPWARGQRCSALRGFAILAGLALLVLIGAAAPDGGAPGPLGPGGGWCREAAGAALDKEEVSPTTVFAAQVPRDPEPLYVLAFPEALVVWPEDVISLSGPLRGSPQEALMAQHGPRDLHTTLVAGVTEPGAADHVPQ